jgi:multiple sugar transport system substrate-binding protein
MHNHKILFKVGFLVMIGCLLTPLLAACGGSSGTGNSSSTGPVTLTFWSWLPNLQNEVDLFEKSHPNIKIKLENPAKSSTEYTKLQTALKAGSGAPDVVQLELSHLPEFILTGKLVDLSQYGASDVKSDYVSWSWSQVSQGSKVYAIPQDSGPMGMLYRTDIFKQYHLSVPKTWDEFAQDARTLHKANPKIYLTDFPPTDSGPFDGLTAQAGSRPFKVNGTNIGVSLDDAAALKVANYWNGLINDKAVASAPDFTNDWYAGLGNGTYATWLTGAWGPTFLSGVAAKSSGKWGVAPLPQWNAGEQVSANFGGSADAVTTQSQHPKEATEFATWLNHDKSSTLMLVQKQSLFPVLNSTLNDPAIDTPSAFFGGQKVVEVFSASSKQIDTTYQWSPFQSYVDNELQNQMGVAVSGKISFEQALHNLQNSTVNYAKNQGFTVN